MVVSGVKSICTLSTARGVCGVISRSIWPSVCSRGVMTLQAIATVPIVNLAQVFFFAHPRSALEADMELTACCKIASLQ